MPEELHDDLTHVDLFSGIGGFALAAAANGIRTIQFCECEPRCVDFLEKAWPGVPIGRDVRRLHWGVAEPGSERIRTRRTEPNGQQRTVEASGPVFLFTAGVPCQPASRAGKQLGREDDRWLWGEAVRLLGEVRPTWAIFENPPGIGDVGLAGILSDVAGKGYDFPRTIDGTPIVHSIPACAVGAPHRRERYWIVCRRIELAHTDEEGREREDVREGRNVADGLRSERLSLNLARPGKAGRETQSNPEHVSEAIREREASQLTKRRDWSRFAWLPCADGKLRRAPDNSFGLVDGLHRSVLAALGNSIVPPVAAEIIRAIVAAEFGRGQE